MKNWILIVLLGVFSPIIQVKGKDIPKNTNKLVNDFANILTPEEEQALSDKLTAYSDSTSNQFAIVIENSLEGDDAFRYSQQLAEQWGIGSKNKNNGLLIYVAIADRKIQIQVGYGLEGAIPDALTRRVRTDIMNPAFKDKRFYEGLNQGIDVFISAAAGEYTNTGEKPLGGKFPKGIIVVIIIIIIIILISRGGGRGMGSRRGFDGPVFWGGTFGSGGFSSGGGGGGGFGGFGGGSFGGGGSGGSW
ncbi:MAG: TPM domain-containing protein [Bacteroidia bacterium]|jgi:uncharacterized protein|nr:TPM domain-containing protein [Bacteroidia bacterium]